MIGEFYEIDYNRYAWAKYNHPGKLVVLRDGLIPRKWYWDKVSRSQQDYKPPLWVDRYVMWDEAHDIVQRHKANWDSGTYSGHKWCACSEFEFFDMINYFAEEKWPWVCVDVKTWTVVRASTAFINDDGKLPEDGISLSAVQAITDDVVKLGSIVDVIIDGHGECFKLVENREDSDVDRYTLVTWNSPIGQAMVGHKTGDTIVTKVPEGEIRFEIVTVDNENKHAFFEYEDEELGVIIRRLRT